MIERLVVLAPTYPIALRALVLRQVLRRDATVIVRVEDLTRLRALGPVRLLDVGGGLRVDTHREFTDCWEPHLTIVDRTVATE